MKISLYTLLFLAVATVILSSCSNKQVDKLLQLEDAMDINPDSVLFELNAIDGVSLSHHDQALHALLTVRAMDKIYDYSYTDSLVDIATDYFENTDDLYHNTLAQYYKGRVRYLDNDYAKSCYYFFKTLDLATQSDDPFWKAMSCRGLSDSYNKSYNSLEELKYARKEYEYFLQSGRQPHINYAILDYAVSLGNNDNKDFYHICEAVIDSAMKYEDLYLLHSSKQTLAIRYAIDKRYNDVISIIKELIEQGLADSVDSMYLALAYTETNDPSKALGLIKNTREEDPSLYSLVNYNIYKNLGMLDKALENLEITDSLTNSRFNQRISQDMTSSIVDYSRMSKAKAEAERDFSRRLLIIISSFSFILLLMLCLYFRLYRNRKQLEIENNVLIAQNLSDALTKSETALELREKELAESQSEYLLKSLEFDKARKSVFELLSARYQMFDEMCRMIFESNLKASQKISRNVNSLVAKMRNDPEIITEMENMIDSHCSNLMTNFKEDLPSLNYTYRKLFLFSVLGFSDGAIALFLNKEKPSMVWDMRRHLKDKIKTLDEQKRVPYLHFFS